MPIELIDVRTGNQVWGQTYEGDPSDIANYSTKYQPTWPIASKFSWIRLDGV